MTRGALEIAVGSLIGGKYRIESVLGRGGMGAVYLATNEDLGRRVAIKVLLGELAFDDTLLKRFRQEARTAAAIGHPGIVDVLDLGTTAEGEPFIVMEALDGETLGARLARGGILPVREALEVIDEALDALAAAHAKGILHRDLKPDNLFLVARPVPLVKILDFGISKLGDGGDDVSLTRTGMVFGTPLFMAPEQARGAKNAGPASDVYAMGAILYQLLTGRTPFTGASYNEVLSRLLTEPFESLSVLRPDLPLDLVAAIERMLAKDAASRPQTAADARDALRALAPAPVDVAARSSVRQAVAELAVTAPPTVSPIAMTVASEPALVAVAPVVMTSAATSAADVPTSLPAATGAAPTRRSWVPWIGAGVVIAGLAAVVATRHSEHAAAPDAGAAPRPLPIVTEAPDAGPADAGSPDAAPPDATVIDAPSGEHTILKRPDAHPAAVVPDAAAPTSPPADAHGLTIDPTFPGSP